MTNCPKCGIVGPESDGEYCRKCGLTHTFILRNQIAALQAVVDDLDALRAEEGASIIIGCDNPDGDGCHVDVEGHWTAWKPLRVPGKTLAEALHKARESMEEGLQ